MFSNIFKKSKFFFFLEKKKGIDYLIDNNRLQLHISISKFIISQTKNSKRIAVEYWTSGIIPLVV